MSVSRSASLSSRPRSRRASRNVLPISSIAPWRPLRRLSTRRRRGRTPPARPAHRVSDDRRSPVATRANRIPRGGTPEPRTVTSMPPVAYRYELRRSDEIVSTGHLTLEQPLEVGDRLEIGGHTGVVATLSPSVGETEIRLVVQLLT